jgi:hypothetical protein
MNIHNAIQHMRKLTEASIPFSIEFVTMNTTNAVSKGLKIVPSCMLRTGLSKEYSDKAGVLIGYIDMSDNSNKWFYMPLLLKFNNIDIE